MEVFTTILINTASVPSNLQSFEDQILCMNSFKCDVMGFSETRLNSNVASLYNVCGYTMYLKHQDRHSAGVVMYVSHEYTTLTIHDLSISEPHLQCICVELWCGGDKYFLPSTYRPPYGNMN